MLNSLKYLPIFFLPFGCIGVTSSFQALAVIIFIISYYKYNNKSDFTTILKLKSLKYNLWLIGFWLVSVAIADIYSHNSITGIKESWHYLQRMLPFLLVCLFFIKEDKYFKFAWLGLIFCTLIIDINILYNLYVQNHWRPFSMMGGANQAGGFLILLLPFVISGTYIFHYEKIYKILGIVTIILTFLSLVILGCRGALLGVILGYFLVGSYILIKKYPWRIIIKFCTLIIISLFVIISGLYFIKPDFIFRSYDMERVYLMNSSIKMFLDYPLFGVGNGNFNDIYVSKYINSLAKEPNLPSPHNIFLYFFVERGIFAGISFFLMFIYQVYTFGKNILSKTNGYFNLWAAAGCVSVLGMGLHGMVDTQIQMRAYFLMYWFLFGLAFCSITLNNLDRN